jgi:hypothetical protein
MRGRVAGCARSGWESGIDTSFGPPYRIASFPERMFQYTGAGPQTAGLRKGLSSHSHGKGSGSLGLVSGQSVGGGGRDGCWSPRIQRSGWILPLGLRRLANTSSGSISSRSIVRYGVGLGAEGFQGNRSVSSSSVPQIRRTALTESIMDIHAVNSRS